MLTETHTRAYWRSPHRPPPRLAPGSRACRGRRAAWVPAATLGAVAAASIVLCSGCLRNDPTYNRFSPRGPSALDAGEAVMDAADEGLVEVQRLVDDAVD